MNTLDVTAWNKKGRALSDAISEAVDNKSNYIIVPIPSVLKLTSTQYLSLKGIDALTAMQEMSQITGMIKKSKREMFHTKKGYVLELKVEF